MPRRNVLISSSMLNSFSIILCSVFELVAVSTDFNAHSQSAFRARETLEFVVHVALAIAVFTVCAVLIGLDTFCFVFHHFSSLPKQLPSHFATVSFCACTVSAATVHVSFCADCKTDDYV
jgi:hypothetical protein